jgi:hypothetical protein
MSIGLQILIVYVLGYFVFLGFSYLVAWVELHLTSAAHRNWVKYVTEEIGPVRRTLGTILLWPLSLLIVLVGFLFLKSPMQTIYSIFKRMHNRNFWRHPTENCWVYATLRDEKMIRWAHLIRQEETTFVVYRVRGTLSNIYSSDMPEAKYNWLVLGKQADRTKHPYFYEVFNCPDNVIEISRQPNLTKAQLACVRDTSWVAANTRIKEELALLERVL